MLINFEYDELLTISCALHCLDIVYGDNAPRSKVMSKVDDLMETMNHIPIDRLYSGIVEVCNEK